MKISKGLTQAYALQDFAYEALMSLRATLTGKDGKLIITREDASAIVSLEKAWQGCQERISFHRRIPSPGSLRPKPEKKSKPRKLLARPVEVEYDSAPVGSAVRSKDELAPQSPNVVSADVPITAPSEITTGRITDASTPCPVCHGTGKHRNSNFGVNMQCSSCKGTGRRLEQSA